MKWISFLGLVGVLISPVLLAVEPVTMSGPVPPIASTYVSNASNTVIYTITNNVPNPLPLTVSGISNGVTRTSVANDCGNTLPAGPSTCNIGIAISTTTAQVGKTINQTLVINYEGRTTLTSPITFSVIQLFAYVSSSPSATTINKFSLDPTSGQFDINTVAYTAVSGQHFGELTFATVGGVQYAYVLDQNGFVYKCDIAGNGDFSSCTATPLSPPSWAPYSIAFTKMGGVQYAYVADINNNFIYQCSLNVGGSSNGTFNSCVSASAALPPSFSFDAPYGIGFATIDGVQYAYVADAGNGGGTAGFVYQCTLDTSGFLTSCTAQTDPGSSPGWIPYAVNFATSGGKQYAYVSDNGNSGVGHVYLCTLTVGGTFNGSFESCSATPTSSVPSPNVPSNMAFATIDGTQYAYVANYQGGIGGMYVCTVDSNGTFSNCNVTTGSPPITGWTPVCVALGL